MLKNLGHSDTFWSYEPKASTRLLNRYFDTGTVDTSLYRPAKVDFTPDASYPSPACLRTAFRRPALAAPDVPARAPARSLQPPGQRPAALHFHARVGARRLARGSRRRPLRVPNRVNRNPVGRARTVGLVTSLGAALAGAWLGFHAARGLMAVVSTIIGAALGANLGLLTLDVRRDRQARSPEAMAPDALPIQAPIA